MPDNTATNAPRAARTALGVAVAATTGMEAEAAPSLEAAIERAAQFPASRVLICGSLIMAREALMAETR